MTQAPDRKRYEGQIDGLVIKQTRNGADYVEVKLLRERMQYPDTCRGFNEDIVALMRDVPLGSYAMLLIDESPGMYQGKTITNRNIVGYEAISGPSGDPAVEGYWEPEQPPDDELYGGPTTLPTKPSAPTPYVTSDERRQASIERQVAFKEARIMMSEAIASGKLTTFNYGMLNDVTDSFETILNRSFENNEAEEDDGGHTDPL